MGTRPVPDVPARGVNFPPQELQLPSKNQGVNARRGQHRCTVVFCSSQFNIKTSCQISGGDTQVGRKLRPALCVDLSTPCGEVSNATSLNQLGNIIFGRAQSRLWGYNARSITQGYSPDGNLPLRSFSGCVVVSSCLAVPGIHLPPPFTVSR